MHVIVFCHFFILFVICSFSSKFQTLRDDLRSGSGMVCEDKHKTTKLVVEAAVVISEISNSANNCFGARCSDTEVV